MTDQTPDQPAADLAEQLKNPAVAFDMRIRDGLDSWFENHVHEMRRCAEASDFTKLVMDALRTGGVTTAELYRLRRIESALIEEGLPIRNEKNDPGGHSVDWIKYQFGYMREQQQMLTEVGDVGDQLESVLAGGDDTVATADQDMTAGQLWHRLCSMHSDVRLQFLSILLDLQRVGRRCYTEDHLARLHEVRQELDRLTEALADALGLKLGDSPWSDLVDTVSRQQNQIDEQRAKLNGELREHALFVSEIGELTEHLKLGPDRVSRDYITRMLGWLLMGDSLAEAMHNAERWRADGGDVYEVRDILLLVEVDASPALVRSWTTAQRRKALEWAGAMHLKASDNNVEVPPRPEFLPGTLK